MMRHQESKTPSQTAEFGGQGVDRRLGRLPHWAVGLIWSVSLLPALLMLAGVDFGAGMATHSFEQLAALPSHEATDTLFHSMAGAFAHALLEWSAVVAAAVACLLCLTTWAVSRNPTLPIIGVALLCAGSMDAFHTLAATRLIEASADNRQLLPFTWVLARIFNVVITVVGVLLCTRGKRNGRSLRPTTVGLISIGLVVLAYAVIQACALNPDLPKAMFPNGLIKRRYDVAPLLMWVVAAWTVFLPFHRQEGTVLSHALMLAVVPQIATELHMAFGSAALFDSHFNVAHFMKVIAYGVPVVGLLFEYVWVLQSQREQVEMLVVAEKELVREKEALAVANKDLRQRNEELDEFAHVASHDLQEPLRKLVAFSGLLKSDLGVELNEEAASDLHYITDAASRMSDLVSDISDLSRSGRQDVTWERVDVAALVSNLLSDNQHGSNEDGVQFTVDSLPELEADATLLRRLFDNLISNGLKYSSEKPMQIRISCESSRTHTTFFVEDNGIGIAAEYREQVFAPFKRLHGVGEFEGTGMGLAICKRSVGRMGGDIWVEEAPGGGCRFGFSIPKKTNRTPAAEAEGHSIPVSP
ncbi:MAG: signal transduction histidine kinase [Planctomycetota bacterium]|jgi:signal transduction histidine kinase